MAAPISTSLISFDAKSRGLEKERNEDSGTCPLFMGFLGKTSHFGGFLTLPSAFLRGGQSDPQIKCRGLWDPSNGIKYMSPSVLNTVFWGKTTHIWWHFEFSFTFRVEEGSVGLFYRFFVDISAILPAVEFIFVALRSEPIAGPYGLKIILPPNFGAPLLFYLWDFSSFFDGFW